jgi:hypothetical protein
MNLSDAIMVALIGGAAGLAGALLGSWITARESRANRIEARRTRFHDDLRRVATDLYQAAERHRKAREAQWTRWIEVVDLGLDPDTIPAAGTTDPIFDAAVALELVASRPTAAAAWNLHGASTRMDFEEFTYDAVRHRRGSSVEGPSPAVRASFQATLESYHRRAWEFANTIRDELSVERLPEQDLSAIPED